MSEYPDTPEPAPEPVSKASLAESITLKLQNPALMETIYAHLVEGGSVIDLCKLWDIPYSSVMRFIRADKARTKTYEDALKDRTEWVKERLLSELRAISTCDMTQILDSDGKVLPPDQWPDSVRPNLAAMEVEETFEGHGENRTWTGYVKRIKFHDKLKAADMIGKNIKLWSDPKDLSVTLKLEDLLAASHADPHPPGLEGAVE